MRRLLQARKEFFYIIGLSVVMFFIIGMIEYFLIYRRPFTTEVQVLVAIQSLIFTILLYYKYLKYHKIILNIIVIPVNILLILFFLAFFFLPDQQRSPEYDKCREELVTRFGDQWSIEELNSPKFNEILQKCNAIK